MDPSIGKSNNVINQWEAKIAIVFYVWDPRINCGTPAKNGQNATNTTPTNLHLHKQPASLQKTRPGLVISTLAGWWFQPI